MQNVGEWRSLVAHAVWDRGVAGSNPVSPTKQTVHRKMGFLFGLSYVEPATKIWQSQRCKVAGSAPRRSAQEYIPSTFSAHDVNPVSPTNIFCYTWLMKSFDFRLPSIGAWADCIEPTRDADLFARTDRAMRETILPDGTTAEQHIASGGLERTVARRSRIALIFQPKLRLPTETGLLTQDQVVARTSKLV